MENHLLQCDLCFDAAEGITTLDSGEDASFYLNNTKDDLKLKINAGFSLRRFKFYIAAAALFLVACSAVLIFFGESNSIKLFKEYYKPYPNIIPMVRGSESDFDLRAAMVLYNSGNYEQAVIEFDKILSSGVKNESAVFYEGVSFLSLGNGDKAESAFEKVINIGDSKLKDQAEWYLALSYLLEEKKENAESLL
ncbi:MAG TPA: hypothetical protein VLB50_14445, partial [Ignavibacteriaceae bacterium]|nr:hypothetical protein [Ignavibacteriaceae bacterium]